MDAGCLQQMSALRSSQSEQQLSQPSPSSLSSSLSPSPSAASPLGILREKEQEQQERRDMEELIIAQESNMMVCRYGVGCTHMFDAFHSNSFWHPKRWETNCDIIRTRYICNECAMSFAHIRDLRFHLIAKTAWSNESLVGCRICVCIDCKEWIEATVSAYKNSKHLIWAPKFLIDSKWVDMSRLTFYIVKRPSNLLCKPSGLICNNDSESKDHDEISSQSYAYSEHISETYAMAQSILFKIYGGFEDEDFMAELGKPEDQRTVPCFELLRSEAVEVWKKYKELPDTVHY